jgi:hypothetical protein
VGWLRQVQLHDLADKSFDQLNSFPHNCALSLPSGQS